MTGLVFSDLAKVSIPKKQTGKMVRTYEFGDWKAWEKLSSQTFDDVQRKHPLFKPEFVFFLLEGEVPVATASLRRDPAFDEYGIRITEIYGKPEGDGQEDLRYLCAAVLKNAGQQLTSSGVWASGESEKANTVLKQLGFTEQDLTPRTFYHDHTDYPKRIKLLYRWHTDRMIGESTGNTGDARGDESLYKPSLLGRAWCSVREVTAGENKPFELFYTVGKTAIKKGMTVKFWMAGQGSLGTAPQMLEPGFPGFVEFFPPDVSAGDVAVEPICTKPRIFNMGTGEEPKGGLAEGDLIVGPVTLGFTVTRGELREGETVQIAVGRKHGFTWKKISGRKEFKVIIEPGSGEPKMRLPEPVVVDIRAEAPEFMEVFLPGSAAAGEKVTAVVLVRDRYENRVSVNGKAEIVLSRSADGEKPCTVYLSNGRGEAVIGTMGRDPIQVSARLVETELNIPPAVSNICVPAALTGDRKIFFGDMHTHDFQSTAEGYPADCYRWGRDDKRLDFQSLAIQVHRWIDNEKWTIGKHMNEYFLEEGKYVTFLGFEWQHSGYGDKIIHYLGGDMPYLPVDDPRYDNPASLYEALRGADAFIISHHPGYELDLHVPGTRWEIIETDVDRLVEIWSMHGSSEGLDEKDRPLIKPSRPGGIYEGLKQGVRMGIVAGSDTHTARPGGSTDDVRPYRGGLCCVWAEELTRRSLFKAFLERRTYGITGPRIVLQFTVNGAPMGAEIPQADTRALAVKTWAPTPIKEVQFMKNGELLSTAHVSGVVGEADVVDEISTDIATADNKSDFYHCRVVLADGHLAVCSPVWVG
jgi:hypothetical protein